MAERGKTPKRYINGMQTGGTMLASRSEVGGEKCCPACLGIGSYLGTEWVRDDSGVSIYKTIVTRKRCEICGGPGRVPERSSVRTLFCATRGTKEMEGLPRAAGRFLGGVVVMLVLLVLTVLWWK